MSPQRLAGLFALICCSVSLQLPADERILEYRSDIQVQASGELAVKETIRVRAEGRDIRRGIYRDFPTRYRDRWGNWVNVVFQPLEVRRNGQPEPWHSEAHSNGSGVYFGSADRMLPAGVHEYQFTFVTNRQLGFFDDHDELYFNVIGHDWQFPIDRGVATISLPFDVPDGQLQTSTYSGAYGAGQSNAQASITSASEVLIETTRALAPGEGLTVAVSWPKGLITEPAASQKIRWFLSDNGAVIVLLAGLLAPLGWYLWAWNKVGRDPDKGVIIPRFEPPAGLSPAACSYVTEMSFDRDAFTAAIVSLAVKGQLRIEETDDTFTLVRATDAPEQRLTSGEQSVLATLLPGAGDRIEMDNEKYRDFQAAQDALKQALKKEYLGRLFRLNSIYILPPVLMSVAAAVMAAFFHGGPAAWIIYSVLTLALHGLFLFLMRAPTPAGRKVMDEIEGFRHYLKTAEQDRLDRMRSPRLTPEVFESFLPYAYALGVANQWCQRFAREMPREIRNSSGYQPGWYQGRFDGTAALYQLGDSFSRSFPAAISSASSPPGSSSGSGGGGFSGGGGGGGGGGGW
jgi:uncharacterized protein (TIGR04222 family)